MAHKLGKAEDEIAGWPLKRLGRWMAYFKIIREEEERQLKAASQGRYGSKQLPSAQVE